MVRELGFYWIRVGSMAPEVAFWVPKTRGWVLTGSNEPLSDHRSVTVLAGPLTPPKKPPR